MSAPLDAVSPAHDSKARHDGLCRKTASAAGVDPDAVIGFLDDVEQAGLDLHGFMPVSYTHLDVYKRQSQTVERPLGCGSSGRRMRTASGRSACGV